MAANRDEAEVYAEIRANIAFEQMVVAALASAVASVLAVFVYKNFSLAIAGAWSLPAAAFAIYKAISFSSVFFLFAFVCAAVIGIPLFKALERMQIRKIWPYVVAATATSLLVAAVVGVMPTFDSPERFALLAPGVAMALIFGRLMRPVWRAAMRKPSAGPPIVRLH